MDSRPPSPVRATPPDRPFRHPDPAPPAGIPTVRFALAGDIRQREFARRAAALRARLIRVCEELLGPALAAENREAVAPHNI